MRALKALVIGMGILIVIGFGLVGYAVLRKVRAPDIETATAPAAPRPPLAAAATPAVPAAPYGPVQVKFPPGARVLAIEPSAGRLLVQLELADGARRVLVLDLATGAEIGSFDLRPQP